jgi:hypothetical protein
MIILVADTCVFMDLEVAGLLEHVFRLPDWISTPDFLYANELAAYNGQQLLDSGLQIIELTSQEMTVMQRLKSTNAALSLPDCAAYVGAQRPDHELLTGDGVLRSLAAARGLPHHGVLWIMDHLLESGAATTVELHTGLTTLSQHNRCRLPRHEIEIRLIRWGQ